jgi:hypothetical protein
MDAPAAAPSPWGGARSPPASPPRPQRHTHKHTHTQQRGLVLSVEECLRRGEAGLGKEAAEKAGGVRVEITSPRALEACRRLGIDPKELTLLPASILPVSPSSSPRRGGAAAHAHNKPAGAVVPLPPEAEAKVFEHRRARLLELLKMVRRERQALIRREQQEQEEEAQLAWLGGQGMDAPWSSDPQWRGHSPTGPSSPVPPSLRAPPSSPAFGSPARVRSHELRWLSQCTCDDMYT